MKMLHISHSLKERKNVPSVLVGLNTEESSINMLYIQGEEKEVSMF